MLNYLNICAVQNICKMQSFSSETQQIDIDFTAFGSQQRKTAIFTFISTQYTCITFSI